MNDIPATIEADSLLLLVGSIFICAIFASLIEWRRRRRSHPVLKRRR
jgi:uncharacterized iron-regulated membrane protein